ncbi:hypothetical protein [Nesterenkonia ebinurensis]|nr:hypothetical protein [Nesterenkonia ebinurensis]
MTNPAAEERRALQPLASPRPLNVELTGVPGPQAEKKTAFDGGPGTR